MVTQGGGFINRKSSLSSLLYPLARAGDARGGREAAARGLARREQRGAGGESAAPAPSEPQSMSGQAAAASAAATVAAQAPKRN